MQEVALRFSHLSFNSFHLIECSRVLRADSRALLEGCRRLRQRAKQQNFQAAFKTTLSRTIGSQ